MSSIPIAIESNIVNPLINISTPNADINSSMDETLKASSNTGLLNWEWWSPNIPLDVVLQREQTLSIVIRTRLSDASYGKEELNRNILDLSQNAPSIEQIWRITKKLPSLTEILLKERNNE